jgi:hypothetical protein
MIPDMLQRIPPAYISIGRMMKHEHGVDLREMTFSKGTP